MEIRYKQNTKPNVTKKTFFVDLGLFLMKRTVQNERHNETSATPMTSPPGVRHAAPHEILLSNTAAWFGVLNQEQQARVLRDTAIYSVSAGDMIERRGEPSLSWIGVISGLIKVSVGNSDGKLASLTGVPAGGWIGEGSLLKREIRKYDVVALRDSTIAKLPSATFEWLLDSSIPFNRFLLQQLNERVAQFIGKAESDRLHQPEARVARCLAELFNPILYPGMGMKLEITQEEIGFLARVSRQRVNQALQLLESINLVKLAYGSVEVLDLKGLRRYGV